MDQDVAMPLLIAASIVLTVIAVMRWCFAFDGARWIGSFDLRTDEEPAAAHELQTVDKAEEGGGLRHTDIQRRAAGQLAEWVAKTWPTGA